jgi:predicted DNA-binding protein
MANVTKAVAARIPFENYYKLHSLADFEGMKMSDYLNVIINQHLEEKATLIENLKEPQKSGDLKALINKMQHVIEKMNNAKG